jgi:ABC-2 type transport system permease protein
MKQLRTVFKFELLNFYKNKAFVGITVAFVIIIAGLLSFPRIKEMLDFNKGDGEVTTDIKGDVQTIAIQDNSGSNPEATLQFFQASMKDFKFELVDKSLEEIKSSIEKNEYKKAIIIEAPLKYKYIADFISMNDYTEFTISELLQQKYKFDEMARLGIEQEEATSILTAVAQAEVISIGKVQMDNFWYTYIIIFMLYMAIMMYGQMVAMSVATEKSTRAMEMLITSAKPVNLIFGKVFGSGLAGLTQMAAILGTSVIFYNMNQSYWGGNFVIAGMFNIKVDVLIYSLTFFILGYFLYSFIFGALGSLATRTEDVNVSIMPVTMIFVIAFMIVMFSMSSGNIDSTLMKIVSYIPFTSPMAMLARITMGEVPTIGVIISIVILILSTIGIGYLSAKIYQIGVLLYGKTLKISELLKMRKQKI